MKNDNAISFNLILKWSLSLDVIDKSKLLQYNSSNSVMNLEWSICFGGIAKWSLLERRSITRCQFCRWEIFLKNFSGSWGGGGGVTRSQVKLGVFSFDKSGVFSFDKSLNLI